jgi:hypothetical protein
VVAANVCFEPLVGLLVRRELLMRSVRFNGDILTQAISHAAQLEWEWTRAWTVELIRFLLDDAEHGGENRQVLERWLGEWMPLAEEAALALGPVFADLPDGIPFDDARANVQIDMDELFEEITLTQPASTAGGAR